MIFEAFQHVCSPQKSFLKVSNMLENPKSHFEGFKRVGNLQKSFLEDSNRFAATTSSAYKAYSTTAGRLAAI